MNNSPQKPWNIFNSLVIILILIGFWLRFSFLLGNIYHVDEFISMLAATVVAQHGLPILPSGLFYDHGLLFSLFSGAFVALLDFREEITRWPTILVSVLTIAAYFAVARRLFASNSAGLLAATLVALDGLSMVWGVRARMYSQAHLFVLLTLALLLESTLKQPSPRGRYLFLLFLTLALFSHTVSFLILLPLAVVMLIFLIFYRSDWLRQPGLWLQVVIAIAIVAGAMSVVAVGQTGSTVSLQDENAVAAAPLGLDFLQGFFDPGITGDRYDDLLDFFQTDDYAWLLPIIGLSLLVSGYRLLRRKITFVDIALLFLTFFAVLVVAEQSMLLTGNWRKARYLFIIVMPAFLLVSAASLDRLLRGGVALLLFVSHRLGQTPICSSRIAKSGVGGLDLAIQTKPLFQILAPLAGVGLIVLIWGADAWDTAHAQGTGNYNTAFEFVDKNWQPGDKIITVHPSAAYLYAGHADYYANQVSAKVIENDEEANALIDRYIGSPLIDTVDKFNAALAESSRVWFVVDDSRLYRRYDPFFTQQIFAQMDHVRHYGGVYVFVSKPHPVPAAAEPLVDIDGNFSNLIHLKGYSIDPDSIGPDGSLPITLFWKPATNSPPPIGVPKVFVQFRNSSGETLAQADHFIYEGLLTLEVWGELYSADEWLRDTANLQLPLPLSTNDGPYSIYVGLYNPATFERIPVVNDTSDENAVVLNLPALPN